MPVPAVLRLEVDPSSRRPFRDEAYLTLRRAILSGEFKPGDRLVEREVATKLGLSRSPVREAFRRLEQEGLIRVTRQGLFVQGLDPTEVEELYHIRQYLEAWVARLAARNSQPDHALPLEEILSRMAAALTAEDHEAVAAEGIRFHQTLAQIAGNRRLARLVFCITEETDRFRRLNLAFVPRSQSALDEHRQILAAVIAHDEERAAQLMSEHIGKALAQAQQYEAYVIEVPLIQFRHK